MARLKRVVKAGANKAGSSLTDWYLTIAEQPFGQPDADFHNDQRGNIQG